MEVCAAKATGLIVSDFCYLFFGVGVFDTVSKSKNSKIQKCKKNNQTSNPMDVGAAKTIRFLVLLFFGFFGLWLLTAVQYYDDCG